MCPLEWRQGLAPPAPPLTPVWTQQWSWWRPPCRRWRSGSFQCAPPAALPPLAHQSRLLPLPPPPPTPIQVHKPRALSLFAHAPSTLYNVCPPSFPPPCPLPRYCVSVGIAKPAPKALRRLQAQLQGGDLQQRAPRRHRDRQPHTRDPRVCVRCSFGLGPLDPLIRQALRPNSGIFDTLAFTLLVPSGADQVASPGSGGGATAHVCAREPQPSVCAWLGPE